MLNDTLSNVLSNILNYERLGNKECTISPSSKVIKAVLDLLNQHGYIGKAEELTPEKGGVLKVSLLGVINKCGVIKPRFSFKVTELEKYEKRFLPAKHMGILVVSTPKGVMSHSEAKKIKSGGKLLAYCY